MASEYGWSITEILEHVYIDQLILLLPIIERRKLDEHRILLALISNPHVKDPNRLWRLLRPIDETTKPEKLDKTSFSILKTKLSQGSRIVVK